MSENTASARCSEAEYRAARVAGILVVTTQDEEAVHAFAESIRTEARAAVAELVEAAHAAKRAFLMGQPEVRGTDTVYPLDGALVGNALDSLRAALAACGVKS